MAAVAPRNAQAGVIRVACRGVHMLSPVRHAHPCRRHLCCDPAAPPRPHTCWAGLVLDARLVQVIPTDGARVRADCPRPPAVVRGGGDCWACMRHAIQVIRGTPRPDHAHAHCHGVPLFNHKSLPSRLWLRLRLLLLLRDLLLSREINLNSPGKRHDQRRSSDDRRMEG